MGEPDLKRMTVDAFLDWQQSQELGYELVDGFPVLPLKAMTGATHAHDTVVVNVLRELSTLLRRKPCKPTTDAIALKSPRAMSEAPPSTMNFDRVKKLDEYKTVPTLAYVLLRLVMPRFIRGIQLSASRRSMIDPGSPGCTGG